MEEKHLTPEEVLLANKYCMGQLSPPSCVGCPNAMPGTEDAWGMCECKYELKYETIRVLEALINQ